MEKIRIPEDEWRGRLTPDQFRITREAGTERAFTGEYWNAKTRGTYHCVCCGLALFPSDTKYESGTGWPSFWRPVDEAYVETRTDSSHGMTRTEVACARCDAHLGHLFEDGPPPTGQRYCLNSASLQLVKAEDG